MTKAEIRKEYLNRRKSLSPSEYLNGCKRISDLFFSSFDISFIKTLHTFLPMAANKEPDTWLIIERIRRKFPNIRLSIPRINKTTDELENFYFEGLHQLEENNWGIKQPKQGVPVGSDKIDLVLVPLLAFDITGHRVGYGKGYYDKFLTTCNPECLKIGLSLLPPLSKIPSETGDVQLNACITPEKIYYFDGAQA